MDLDLFARLGRRERMRYVGDTPLLLRRRISFFERAGRFVAQGRLEETRQLLRRTLRGRFGR